MKDYYAVLGIASDAPLAEIRQAYRRSAQQYHPDRNRSPEAPERFRDVQEAYETLSDVRRRHDYDENRRRNLLEKPLETAQEIWNHYLAGVLS
ncbi:MAG TPA: DnaJ domain-containing protein [Accumulibacter sp.]|uniref:DnaJ domain-containing protein n=1 Tax=Accumulibacter sp. TaxID=2053492 RepID=UPI002609090C|nr:DnaJ domain-containing protein [Accumulibacter sp.]MDS4056672.1 DnaJ domain-containing protein [Accumulibacter sp.]HMV07029.1 DnaJ domain-containing protein [Accumulibacter sp.]HMW63273.1 DnaJ domain-containing protein [Accumulibacter sp.]HMW79216.1 DnaJ domain-containing protein [Accumulibacter sp.]HMX67397.1 DnaJ domain-containing protein [Accumulibacter sp.]